MLTEFLKKPSFWLAGAILVSIILGVILFYQKNEPQFVLEPMPKNDLEVTIQDGKQIVNAKTEGYQLILDPKYKVVTRAVEPGRVMIFNDKDCRATVVKLDASEGMTIQEWFMRSKKAEEYAQTYEIVDYHIEKIPNNYLEAYYKFFEDKNFGLDKSILIQGKNGIFSISQNTPDCFSLDEILTGFRFQ